MISASVLHAYRKLTNWVKFTKIEEILAEVNDLLTHSKRFSAFAPCTVVLGVFDVLVIFFEQDCDRRASLVLFHALCFDDRQEP